MPFQSSTPIQSAQNLKRIKQQNITPKEVDPASMSQTNILNTTTEFIGPVSLNNNSALSIRSIISNSANPLFRLGAVPFEICFFQTSLAIGSIIGDTVSADYVIIGPMAVPQFSPLAQPTTAPGGASAGGSDGNNLVFITQIINYTGATKTIYAATSTRVLTPVGGSGSANI